MNSVEPGLSFYLYVLCGVQNIVDAPLWASELVPKSCFPFQGAYKDPDTKCVNFHVALSSGIILYREKINKAVELRSIGLCLLMLTKLWNLLS